MECCSCFIIIGLECCGSVSQLVIPFSFKSKIAELCDGVICCFFLAKLKFMLEVLLLLLILLANTGFSVAVCQEGPKEERSANLYCS